MKTRIPSVDTIHDRLRCERPVAIKIRRLLDGRDDPMTYEKVNKWAGQCFSTPRSTELIMCAIDELLDTHGTESIRAEDAHWDSFYFDTVAVYCNAGDSYYATVLYDVERDTFYVTSTGDWIETSERTGRYKFA